MTPPGNISIEADRGCCGCIMLPVAVFVLTSRRLRRMGFGAPLGLGMNRIWADLLAFAFVFCLGYLWGKR